MTIRLIGIPKSNQLSTERRHHRIHNALIRGGFLIRRRRFLFREIEFCQARFDFLAVLAGADLLVDRLDLAVDPDVNGPALGEAKEPPDPEGSRCLSIAIAEERELQFQRLSEFLVGLF